MVAGAFIAMLLVPLVNRMDHFGVPKVLSIVFALLLSVLVIILIIWFFGSQISGFSEDLAGIQTQFETFSADFTLFMKEYLGMDVGLDLDSLSTKIFSFLKNNATNISDAAFSTLSGLGLIILIPIYSFMFLLYRDHFTGFVVRLFNKYDEKRVKFVVTDLRRVIQKYLTGVLQVMTILAVLNVSALSILGIKHAFFFGVFAAVLNIIPYVGPLVGNLLPMLFALLTKDSLWYPVGVLISFAVIQSLEGNYLTPKIVGSNVNINPLVSLIALLVGSLIWGVVGMILFIPMTAILKKLLELHPSTEVYGFLLGEGEPQEKPVRRKGLRFSVLFKKKEQDKA